MTACNYYMEQLLLDKSINEEPEIDIYVEKESEE